MVRLLKRIGLVVAIFLTAPLVCAAANDQPDSSVSEQLVRTQLEQLDTEPLESFWRDLKQEYGRYMPGGEKGVFLTRSFPRRAVFPRKRRSRPWPATFSTRSCTAESCSAR